MQKVPQGHTPRTTMSADTFNTLSSGSIGHGVYAGQLLLQNTCLVQPPVCQSAHQPVVTTNEHARAVVTVGTSHDEHGNSTRRAISVDPHQAEACWLIQSASERVAPLAAAGNAIALKSQKLGASVPLLAAPAAKDPYRLKRGSSS